jgi:hypothetical protein
VSTARVLAAALIGAALLAARLPGALPLTALVALLAVGELWLRALSLELEPPAGRIGLAVICGLISLPSIALGLHLTGVPIRARSLAAGLAVLALLLGGAALRRERSGRSESCPQLPRTLGALALPAVVALVVGGAAVLTYARLPHPPQPGYTGVALGGWAADIDGPIAIPHGGLDVPIRVSSAGEPAAVEPLSVLVDTLRVAPPHPVPIAAGITSSIEVHVPAPPNGCPHRIEISLGPASVVFYGRGPAPC